MKLLNFASILTFLTMSLSALSQPKSSMMQCGGLNILDVKPTIEGITPCAFCEISISRLKNGFRIVLADSSYKIKGFHLIYSDGLTQRDFEMELVGNRVTAKNFKHLKGLKIGDQLDFECINILKNGELSLATSFRLVVDK